VTLSLKHPDACLKLLLGIALAVWVLLGVAFVVLGFFDSLWLIRGSGELLLICLLVWASAKVPATDTRRRVKWSLVRIGVAYILGLALAAFYWYYCT
jgi:uncharacterized membrane protein YGL010W